MRKPRAAYSAEIAVAILNGLAAGRGLRALCRGPGMPTRATVMRWLHEHPDFAAYARTARRAGRLDRPGRPSLYTPALLEEIYLRLSQGEPLRTLCRDPAMPSRSTLQAWGGRRPDVARTLDLAAQNAAFAEADRRLDHLGGRQAFAAWLDDKANAAHDPRKDYARPQFGPPAPAAEEDPSSPPAPPARRGRG
jgi:hypothetical protein